MRKRPKPCAYWAKSAFGLKFWGDSKFNDHANWHQMLLRYQYGTGSSGSTKWRSAIDPGTFPTWWSDSSRADIGQNDKIEVPASVANGTGTLTVGGRAGIVSSYGSRDTAYAGAIDDVVVLNRLMSIRELSRYYETGETYVFIRNNSANFSSGEDWSTEETGKDTRCVPVPGAYPGAAYIVDGNKTVSANVSGTFGGSGNVSLTIGRLEPLYNQQTEAAIIAAGDTLKGSVAQSGNISETSFYDLRLNKGSLQFVTGLSSTTFNTTYLDVAAPSSAPFEIATKTGVTCTMTVAQPVTGDGVLAKTGYGTLIITKFDSAARASPKIRLRHGTIKTPVLSGYQKDSGVESGTVLVSATGNPVVFRGDDVWPTTTNKMKIKFDGAFPTAKTAVMTVPSGFTADMIQDTTAYDAGDVYNLTVENNTVYVTPVPATWDGAYLGGRTAENKCFYSPNETMTFRLQIGGITRLPKGAGPLRWKRTGDDGVTTSGVVDTLPLAEPLVLTTSLDRPGFVRIEATIDGAPDDVRFDGGAGVDLSGIVANQGEPTDFDGFWRHQLAELDQVALEAELTELDSPKAGVKLFKYSIPCAGGKPSTGYLTYPENETSCPAQLIFYGYNESWSAGAMAAPSAGSIAEHSIQLRVNAHGLEVGREASYYEEAKAAVSYGDHLHGWNPADNAEPETSYYLGMALRGVRAAQFAQTLEKWNGTDLYVRGGSQGALQSILVASLCHKVNRADVHINWMCDVRGKALGGRLASEFQPDYRPGLDYFDEVFHARRVSTNCAVYVSQAGLGDYTSPPTGIACFYNALRGQKEITFKQNAEHGWTTPDPSTPTYKFQAAKMAEPGPDIDWRDIRSGATVAEHGLNFTNAVVTVGISDAGGYLEGEAYLRLTAYDEKGAVAASVDQPLDGAGDYSFSMPTAPGATRTYGFSLVDEDGNAVSRGTAFPGGSYYAGRDVNVFHAYAETLDVSGGAWDKSPATAGGAYQVMSDDGNVAFAVANPQTALMRAQTRLPFLCGYRESKLDVLLASVPDGTRAGVVLVEGASATYWARLGKTDGGGYELVRLYGDDNPDTGAAYDVAVVTDTLATPARVSYLVGPADGPAVRLRDANGDDWFDLPTAAAVAHVGYRGEMRFSALDGLRDTHVAYELEDKALVLNTDVQLDPNELAEGSYSLQKNGFGFRWTDSAKYMTYDEAHDRYNVSSARPANGLPGFMSYMLGLNAADPSAIPAIAPVQTADPGKVTLKLSNVRQRDEPGVSVRYTIVAAGDRTFAEIVDSDEKLDDSTFEMDLPASGVRYYKVQAELE